MICFVTGASGFVGRNLVRELVSQGHRVRGLVRPEKAETGLTGLDAERVIGDLNDRTVLRQALQGCDWCFHVAASYHLWMRDYRPMFEANVGGTRNVLQLAGEAGCSRIVYTSTVGCIGVPESAEQAKPADENCWGEAARMRSAYKRSKWEAERVARELAERNRLPVVIVNPSAPVGAEDMRPTPTGQVIVDFLNRAMPAYLETGLNWVHVRDVARGHILAAERGRVGERYILGHAEGNWTLAETFSVLSEITGLPAPQWRLPYWVALLAAYCSERVAGVTGKAPRASLAGVRMARYKMFFDPSKAIRELGLPQTPPRVAFAEAVDWFRNNGYVRR